MNDKIREEINTELQRLGWSKAELARQLATSPNYVSNLLVKDGTPNQKGKISANWLKLFDYFGYELVIVKKKPKKNERRD